MLSLTIKGILAKRICKSRYYRQILYGCTNPRCEVPTCLSRQKGVSKGPFRPYTVLSARCLASFLASQDQPEKGLCPHEPINAPALCGPKPTPQANHHGGNLPRVLGDLSRSQETYSCSESSNNGVVEGPFPTVNATIQFGNLSAPKLGEEVSVNDNGKNATDKPENGSGLCKVKDTKSFAQSLFDTAAMKGLHIGDVPEDCLGWMRRSQADQRDGISSDANSQKPSPSGGRLHPAVNVSISEKADRNESTAPAESTGKINDTCEIQTEDVPQERTLPCLDLDGAINADPDFMVSVDSESRSEFRSNNRRLGEVPVARVVQPNRLEEDHPTTEHRSQGPVPKGSKCKFADGVVSEPHSPDEVDEDEGKVQTLSNGVEYSALASPQSLSHFSIANIKGLAESLERKHYDINLKHRLSNLQGRIDSPFHFIGSSTSQAESYWAFLAFSAQSLTYVLGNTEALMRSFLHCDLVNSSRTIIQPYELPLMVSCFQILRSLDFHPQTILPSLWISAGFIYPFNFSRRKIPSNIAGVLLSKGLRGSLNDLEASHIVKIVFAALVATVPTYNNMTIMNAVCKLHASGLTAPLPRVTDPSEQRELHSKVLNAAVAFEDEMALNVAKRLVRAIMARQQRSQSLQGYDRDGCAHQSYLCNTVNYLLTGKTEIIVADNQVSQSVKGGKIIEQVKSELAENLDFPCRVVVEWLRAVIIKEWDGQAKVRKDSALAGALGLMREFGDYSPPPFRECRPKAKITSPSLIAWHRRGFLPNTLSVRSIGFHGGAS